MPNQAARHKTIETPRGIVRIEAYFAPEEAPEYTVHDELPEYADIIQSAAGRSGTDDKTASLSGIALAIDEADTVIGVGTLESPLEGDRWRQLGETGITEIKTLKISRGWRRQSIGRELLSALISDSGIEDRFVYVKSFSWNWDLDEANMGAREYRQVLIRLFESFGFDEYETDDPTISLKVENLFLCRLGEYLSKEVIEQFHRIRFNIPPRPIQQPGSSYATYSRFEDDQSLFTPLVNERYTNLRLYYNWKMDLVTLQVAREWDDDILWEDYNSRFTAEQYLTDKTEYLGNQASRELYRSYGLEEYLNEVIDHVKISRHLGLECFYDPKSDIRIINYLHSSTLGQDHIYRAIRTGGICFTPQDRNEIDMLAEGLNLSRAMSFKNASCQVPFGGCRISILTEPLQPTDREGIGFIAYAIDRTRSFAGPDMGFQPELIDVMRREGYTNHITGGWDSKVGPPAQPTAFGVYLAVKEAAYAKFSSLNLAGKKVVVQGVGAVGLPLVEKYLMDERAEIYVADIDHAPIEHLLLKFPGQINVIRPEQVRNFDADIWIPCATSGVIAEEQIGDLKYRIIIGAANNTLKALNQREEIRLAQLLGQRGILFQIDWLHNTAGIISGAEEYIYQNQASYQRVMDQVENVCRDGVRKNLKEAVLNDITPTEQAYRHFNKMVY